MVRESGRRAMNRRLVLVFFFGVLLFQLARNGVSVGYSSFFPLLLGSVFVLFWTRLRTIVFPPSVSAKAPLSFVPNF